MRISRKAAVAIAVTAALFYLAGANADEKPQEIKACIECQNDAVKELRAMAKSKEFDWDRAGEKSKTWLAAANDIGKNKPPLGDDKSWKEQTDKYVTNVKAIDTAVGKKDADAMNKAVGTFGAS